MVAVRMWLPGDVYYPVTRTGFNPEGEIFRQGEFTDGQFHIQEEKLRCFKE